MTVYLNGSYLPLKEAHVSVMDRGLLFGDGIYEVIRAIRGSLFRMRPHLDRLENGLHALGIQLPEETIHEIPSIAKALLQKNELLDGEATIYLQVTRGAALPRTHTFPDPPVEPTILLTAGSFTPHEALHEQGVDTITVPDVRWARCNLKTVNLLPNTLARQRAVEAGVNSAIMIRDGQVTESPNANIFGVKDGVLYTYPLTSYILDGITRQLVLSLADRLSIPLREVPIEEIHLHSMDELFFSGTTTDIQPVVEIDGQPVGTGKPGPITRAIQRGYKEELYSA
ncbi:MAG: aminotransferase class IV [Balneolaceae bacterium]